MLESNYIDLSLWFFNEWKKIYKFFVCLWCVFKVGKFVSVGNVYFYLKNCFKDMF